MKKIIKTIKMFLCNHKKYICDKQIRILECKECGHRSFVDEYKDLYKK